MHFFKNVRLLRCGYTHHRKSFYMWNGWKHEISCYLPAIYLKESVVHDHHIFKRIWSPIVGEVLAVDMDTEDQYAVAVNR